MLLIALEVLFAAGQKRRHGALPVPGYGRPPAEIASVWRGYLAGMVLVAGAVAIAWWLGGAAAGAVDPVMHVPKRRAAMAILASAPSASFRFLRGQLEISDSEASTTYAMTNEGRRAYQAHCAALRKLIDAVQPESSAR